MHTRKAVFAVLIVSIVAVAGSRAGRRQTRPDPARWEDVIAAWEAEDQISPPPEGAIVFVGSSSIRFWDTIHEDMAPLTVIHRGFGGSWMQDAVHYANRIVTNYKPRAVVVYEGDNDVGAAGLSPEEYMNDLRDFVTRVHTALPDTRIYILAIKPSVSRWASWDAMAEANRLAVEFAASDDRLQYVDVATPMLGPGGGRPSDDIFIQDMLHMNPKGYAIWTDAVRPVLMAHEARYER